MNRMDYTRVCHQNQPPLAKLIFRLKSKRETDERLKSPFVKEGGFELSQQT